MISAPPPLRFGSLSARLVKLEPGAVVRLQVEARPTSTAVSVDDVRAPLEPVSVWGASLLAGEDPAADLEAATAAAGLRFTADGWAPVPARPWETVAAHAVRDGGQA